MSDQEEKTPAGEPEQSAPTPETPSSDAVEAPDFAADGAIEEARAEESIEGEAPVDAAADAAADTAAEATTDFAADGAIEEARAEAAIEGEAATEAAADAAAEAAPAFSAEAEAAADAAIAAAVADIEAAEAAAAEAPAEAPAASETPTVAEAEAALAADVAEAQAEQAAQAPAAEAEKAAQIEQASAAAVAAEAITDKAGDAADAGTPDSTDAATADSEEKPKNKRGLMICIGAAAALLVIAMIVLFASGVFGGGNNKAETAEVPALTEDQVIVSLDQSGVVMPDLAQYAYVSQEALAGPQFEDITVETVANLEEAHELGQSATATATAIYKNDGVEFRIPVTLPFEYSVEGQTWVPGSLVQAAPTATPMKSPSANEIVKNLDDLLTTYDPTYGEQMKGATISKTSSDLTLDGGFITVDLVNKVDTPTQEELRTCTVELTVVWSNELGWYATVSQAGAIDTATTPKPGAAGANNTAADPNAANNANANANANANTNNNANANTNANANNANTNTPDNSAASTAPIKLGKITYGKDIQALEGKILKLPRNVRDFQRANGNYNNPDVGEKGRLEKGQMLVLELTRPVKVTMSGNSYTLKYIGIAVGDNVTSDQIAGLVDHYVTVTGVPEEAFGTNWTPLGLKTSKIEVG